MSLENLGQQFVPKKSDQRTKVAMKAIILERVRQEAKWGVQSHPFGACIGLNAQSEKRIKRIQKMVESQQAVQSRDPDKLTWVDILTEEFRELLAATTIENLREECVQLAAVACAIVEDIDGRP